MTIRLSFRAQGEIWVLPTEGSFLEAATRTGQARDCSYGSRSISVTRKLGRAGFEPPILDFPVNTSQTRPYGDILHWARFPRPYTITCHPLHWARKPRPYG